jgi:hypothetical protein
MQRAARLLEGLLLRYSTQYKESDINPKSKKRRAKDKVGLACIVFLCARMSGYVRTCVAHTHVNE